MIVVDASAAVLALLDKGDARLHLSRDRLAAPHLADAEVIQTIGRLVARGSLDSGAAKRSVLRWVRLDVQRFPIVGFAPRIWALRHNLSAYDACYVSLAEALECPLLTADARMAIAPGPECSMIVLRG